MSMLDLQARAMRTARAKGHRPIWHTDRDRAMCADCAAWFKITQNPRPHEIEISGTAVSLHCYPKKESTK